MCPLEAVLCLWAGSGDMGLAQRVSPHAHLSGKCHSGSTSDQWQPAVTDRDVVSKEKNTELAFKNEKT